MKLPIALITLAILTGCSSTNLAEHKTLNKVHKAESAIETGEKLVKAGAISTAAGVALIAKGTIDRKKAVAELDKQLEVTKQVEVR